MKFDFPFKPTKTSIKTFLLLFFGLHGLNVLLISLVAGFWDGPLGIGIPISFYRISCGMMGSMSTDLPCDYGLNFYMLLLNLGFWYVVASFIKINKHT